MLLGCFLLTCTLPLLADDWPQWRGPNRDGVSKETGLLAQWPEKGPPLLWTFDKAGLGFSGPAIVGDQLYILGARNNEEYLLALDVGKKGAEVWACKVGPMFTFKGNKWGDGPRSTPSVDGKFVYALGGFGDLICATTDKGELVWKKNLVKDLGGEMMGDDTNWGYSWSPLIDGDQLICIPGGPKGAVAALDKKTGNVLWQTKELTEKAAYASPLVADIGGVRQYVAVTYRKNDQGEGGTVSGIRAKDGKLLWTFPYFEGSSYCVIPTPIIHGTEIYVTEGEEIGRTRLLKITTQGGKFNVKNLYTTTAAKKGMKNNHGTVVAVGDYVYGYTDNKGWVCQEWKTGKVAWTEKRKLPGTTAGSLVAADGHLYLFSDEGVAALIKASPEGWQESGRFEIPRKSTAKEKYPSNYSGSGIWTVPVIANGRLYLRDQELLFCYDVRAKK
jgi:outer membrane protein assembly factor BamB